MTTVSIPGTRQPPGAARVDWVDHAKGLCIIMVVMMHSVLGVEKAAGETSWLNGFVMFAQPFRMPDFFLIAGLFLARVIDRDWVSYLDKKVLHFLYFYVIWVVIQAAFKVAGPAVLSGEWSPLADYLLRSLWDPPATMWFVYILPIFFVLAKLVRSVHPLIVIGVAAALEMAKVHTGVLVVDEFCARLVYFMIGYYGAAYAFRFAERVDDNIGLAISGLAVWAVVNGAFVVLGLAHLPVVSLALGVLGAGAVIAMAVLLTHVRWSAFVRHAGELSIVIYLSFFIPMVVVRESLLGGGLVEDVGTIALIVTLAGVVLPLIAHRVTRGTVLRYLFERPAVVSLVRKPVSKLVAAE